MKEFRPRLTAQIIALLQHHNEQQKTEYLGSYFEAYCDFHRRFKQTVLTVLTVLTFEGTKMNALYVHDGVSESQHHILFILGTLLIKTF